MLNHDTMLEDLSVRLQERRFVCLCGPAFKGIIPLYEHMIMHLLKISVASLHEVVLI